MSLFTLCEAAEFVENSRIPQQQSTRDSTINNGVSPVTSNTSDSETEKAKRRPGGAGTREIHNRLEKNRRAQLKICFETLKGEIPSLEDRKTSNLNILKSALRYIQSLEKRTKETSKERDDLHKHNLSLREKLKVLSSDIRRLLELSAKNGIKTAGAIEELPTLSSDMSDASSLSSNQSPVQSVATQTMPMTDKKKVDTEEEDNSSDEEINVDDIAES